MNVGILVTGWINEISQGTGIATHRAEVSDI